jgi:hypothetical protein
MNAQIRPGATDGGQVEMILHFLSGYILLAMKYNLFATTACLRFETQTVLAGEGMCR